MYDISDLHLTICEMSQIKNNNNSDKNLNITKKKISQRKQKDNALIYKFNNRCIHFNIKTNTAKFVI